MPETKACEGCCVKMVQFIGTGKKKKEIETTKEYQETCIKFDLKEGNLYFCISTFSVHTSVDFEIRQLLGNMYMVGNMVVFSHESISHKTFAFLK